MSNLAPLIYVILYNMKQHISKLVIVGDDEARFVRQSNSNDTIIPIHEETSIGEVKSWVFGFLTAINIILTNEMWLNINKARLNQDGYGLWVIFSDAWHNDICIFLLTWRAIFVISCNILALPSLFLMSLLLVNTSLQVVAFNSWTVPFQWWPVTEMAWMPSPLSRDLFLPLPEIPRTADI